MHNFTGRHHETNECLDKNKAVPNKVNIYHHSVDKLGKFLVMNYSLYEDQNKFKKPFWKGHARADVAALRLDDYPLLKYYPYNIAVKREISIKPSDSVSVIGFPFGLTQASAFGIWSTGFIATDLGLNFKDLPCFLIDCRTRSGQSGSPVIAQRNSAFLTVDGALSTGCPRTELLGIYTGRVSKDSDLGYVWKLSVIEELLNSFST